MIFKILGAIGMLIITFGILAPANKDLRRNVFFALGGLLLIAYSISLRDPIFIPLQAVFILTSVYEIFKLIKLPEKKL